MEQFSTVIRAVDMVAQDLPSLSILIPVFRSEISLLIEEVKNQAETNFEDWEIIILDDASGPPWEENYQKLGDHHHIFCHKSEINLGRGAARNRLASLAGKDMLLFLDGDARIVDPDYLRKMVHSVNGECVVTGKTTYRKQKPLQPAKVLRWKYGKHRESVPAALRNKHPWRSFSTFHFVIPASLFSRISFRSLYPGYGHEDTLFGYDLKNEKIPVIHTDIPLQHEGIDEAALFLQKTGEGVDHLALLIHKEGCNTPLINAFRILRFYCRHRWWLDTRFIRRISKYIYPVLHKSLSNGSTSLWLFDLYKLIYLLKKYPDHI